MRLVIRADASRRIGSGHVMRCLALAEAFRSRGSEVHFVCRRLDADLHSRIEAQGFHCSLLPAGSHALDPLDDAQKTAALCDGADWLIVDHYEIDHRWERAMRTACSRLMVIDDLVDRPHDCDILLDQTFGRRAGDYKTLTTEGCQILAGTEYALLRPEFAANRPASLERRATSSTVSHILVSMGGFDPENRTRDALTTLAETDYAARLTVTVVCGAENPDNKALGDFAGHFARLDVRQHVSNMAELMAAADLAIGAGGTTSWERCCMGLPALICIMADNQRDVAAKLGETGAISVWASPLELTTQLDRHIGDPANNQSASAAAAGICDGHGLGRVVTAVESC